MRAILILSAVMAIALFAGVANADYACTLDKVTLAPNVVPSYPVGFNYITVYSEGLPAGHQVLSMLTYPDGSHAGADSTVDQEGRAQFSYNLNQNGTYSFIASTQHPGTGQTIESAEYIFNTEAGVHPAPASGLGILTWVFLAFGSVMLFAGIAIVWRG